MVNREKIIVGAVSKLEFNGIGLLPTIGPLRILIAGDDSCVSVKLATNDVESIAFLYSSIVENAFRMVDTDTSVIEFKSGDEDFVMGTLLIESPGISGRIRRYRFGRVGVYQSFSQHICKDGMSIIPVRFGVFPDDSGRLLTLCEMPQQRGMPQLKEVSEILD